jgi:RsiW-degrading membrane proteinase PrsW (M82 family)
MGGIFALILLLFVVLLPVVPLFVWFRIRRFGMLPFFLALAAGVLSVLIAMLGQSFFTPLAAQDQGVFFLFGIIRISLVEELSRLLSLFLLFRFSFARVSVPSYGAPSGLAAGFGFAAAESIFYSLSDPVAALWRIFTAALHGACGARIGTALSLGRKKVPAAIVLVLTAVLIHTMYNFCILNSSLPSVLAALLAIAALASSLLAMR